MSFLSVFAPHMPKGAIVAFDDPNMDLFPGETLAAMETLGLNNVELRRFPSATSLSCAVHRSGFATAGISLPAAG